MGLILQACFWCIDPLVLLVTFVWGEPTTRWRTCAVRFLVRRRGERLTGKNHGFFLYAEAPETFPEDGQQVVVVVVVIIIVAVVVIMIIIITIVVIVTIVVALLQ